jgi:hypothetical protein
VAVYWSVVIITMSNNTNFKYVSVATVAKAARLSIPAVYVHIWNKNLKASKMPGFREWLITADALQDFLLARAQRRFTRHQRSKKR